MHTVHSKFDALNAIQWTEKLNPTEAIKSALSDQDERKNELKSINQVYWLMASND